MPPFEHLDVLADSTPGGGPWNMAVDQALLERAKTPVLRTYLWSEPQLSIGYFQRILEIENPHRLPVVRRWTGGGTVPHGDDWTFSLIVPKSHPFSSVSPAETYCAIHRAVAAALADSGFPDVALSGSPTPTASAGSCFISPVRDDVMRGDQKIAGGAQRRCRHGLLHQGSIQSVTPPASFLTALASRLATSHSVRKTLTDPELSLARKAESSRYATSDWLHKR